MVRIVTSVVTWGARDVEKGCGGGTGVWMGAKVSCSLAPNQTGTNLQESLLFLALVGLSLCVTVKSLPGTVGLGCGLGPTVSRGPGWELGRIYMPYFRIMSEYPYLANRHNLTVVTAVAVCTIPCSPSCARLPTRKADTNPSIHTHCLTMAARHSCSVQLLDTV